MYWSESVSIDRSTHFGVNPIVEIGEHIGNNRLFVNRKCSSDTNQYNKIAKSVIVEVPWHSGVATAGGGMNSLYVTSSQRINGVFRIACCLLMRME